MPHPKPIALCTDESVIGARFYVMEFVDGFCPRDPLPPPFDTDHSTRRDLGFELVDALANLAEVDGHHVRCQVNGSMAPLLQALAAAGARELLSTKPSLEELFLSHYGPTEALAA